MNVVKVVNVGKTVFSDAYDSQPFVIPPKSETLVPVEAVNLWLGDNTLRDISARDRKRTDEFDRLRVRYGVYSGDPDRPGVTMEEQFEERRPKLEAYTVDGQRIYTLSDDPYGKEHLDVEAAPQTDSGLLQAQFDALQREMDAIRSQMADRAAPHFTAEPLDDEEAEAEVQIPVQEGQTAQRPAPRKVGASLPVDSPNRVKAGGK